MQFVRNAWYVAGWSRDFGEALRALTILNQPLVLFRSSTGKVVALEDRCPHRLLPLSKGRRIGDTIQCGYHGMTFDGAGKCVRVPGQDNLPASAYVDAFPVEERHGIVWIWMGEPALADPGDIFDMPEFEDPNWHAHHGDALHIRAHYLNVAENLVDPAHVSFVHPTTLGSSASEDVPVHVSTAGKVITAWRWIRNAPPVGFFQKFGGFSGNVDRWHYYHLHIPSTAVIDFGSIEAGRNIAEEDRDEGVRIFALHFVTPVSEDYTIDHWMHLRNRAQGDEDASAQMDGMFRTAFAEDVAVLEAVHEAEQRPQKRKPIRIAIDKGPNVYRKRIRDLVEAEATEYLGEPERPTFVQHD
ncbi:aromatic ring-hydroxylating dioxygenase subunit alpha [Cognatishimia sp. F0-27]|uniref:aromatic ring-hydroxylating dioxygenase subunit alpha n=1 Tax=Cognatishimia sp. F0-27 TaxID=2816855 RepID=UPI001D0C5E65|nr:aromatic ring-hydroxylating dioxygenase subunit alpha [Cognatishimia sp. F0-27]MCC1493981.1 aromatic ring-hydroxylating dioxygenase subunit alpha [Cognatishimia sp. F0-27]